MIGAAVCLKNSSMNGYGERGILREKTKWQEMFRMLVWEKEIVPK
jgi:hypothetical protein